MQGRYSAANQSARTALGRPDGEALFSRQSDDGFGLSKDIFEEWVHQRLFIRRAALWSRSLARLNLLRVL